MSDEAFLRAIAREIAPSIRKCVDGALRPLAERIAALESRPLPEDGIGVREALRDREGCLILTLTDGSTVNAGIIRDGEPGKPGEPGRSVDREDVRGLVSEVVAALPPPGKEKPDDEPADIDEAIKAEVERAVAPLAEAVAELAAANDRILGSAGPEAIREAVAVEVAKLPPPPPAEPGKPGKDAEPITDDQLTEVVRRYFAANPPAPGKDGIGLAGALIDREGGLVLTLSDGSTRELGRVDGKDGDPGKAGADGFSLEDLVIEQVDERTVVLRFARGELVREARVTLPGFVDRGVWKPGDYAKGDAVTWGGSLFIAQKATSEKPEMSDDWRLAVKRGRDGKPGEEGKRGLPGTKGEDGKPWPTR